jgi:hypothetical protein
MWLVDNIWMVEYAYRLEGILINKLKDAKAGAPQF